MFTNNYVTARTLRKKLRIKYNWPNSQLLRMKIKDTFVDNIIYTKFQRLHHLKWDVSIIILIM